MTKIFAALLLWLSLYSLAAAQINRTAIDSTNSLALKNATIVDMKTGKLLPNRIVLISNNRIVAVGKIGKLEIPSDAQTVDAGGRFLIPGLWDMHVHFWDADVFYPIALANGITGVRDMGDELETLIKYRNQSVTGERTAPRLVFGGQIVDGLLRENLPFLFDYAATPAAARQFVRKRKALGADFVKVYSHLAPEVFAAVADEAKKQNILFAGHVPIAVGARGAALAGQRSIEHLTGVALACASDEIARQTKADELLAEMRRIDHERANNKIASKEQLAELARKSYDIANSVNALTRDDALDFYDAQKGKDLFALFRRQNTWQVPTLVVGDSTAPVAAERLNYFPPFVRSIIKREAAAATPETIAARKRRAAVAMRIVREMRRAKVPILAGSDAPNPNSYPGFSLHDELALLVEAGLSPLEALQAATVAPAEFLGKQNDLGAIEPGKLADLVLLDANPLTDIRNTTKIRAVVANGKLLTRDALDKMLSDAERKSR